MLFCLSNKFILTRNVRYDEKLSLRHCIVTTERACRMSEMSRYRAGGTIEWSTLIGPDPSIYCALIDSLSQKS